MAISFPHESKPTNTEGQKNGLMVKGSTGYRQWLRSKDSEAIFPTRNNAMDDRYTWNKRNVHILNKQGHYL